MNHPGENHCLARDFNQQGFSGGLSPLTGGRACDDHGRENTRIIKDRQPIKLDEIKVSTDIFFCPRGLEKQHHAAGNHWSNKR